MTTPDTLKTTTPTPHSTPLHNTLHSTRHHTTIKILQFSSPAFLIVPIPLGATQPVLTPAPVPRQLITSFCQLAPTTCTTTTATQSRPGRTSTNERRREHEYKRTCRRHAFYVDTTTTLTLDYHTPQNKSADLTCKYTPRLVSRSRCQYYFFLFTSTRHYYRRCSPNHRHARYHTGDKLVAICNPR